MMSRKKAYLQTLFVLAFCALLCAGARASDAPMYREGLKRPSLPSGQMATLFAGDDANLTALRDYFRARVWDGATEITINPADYGGVSIQEAGDTFYSLYNDPDMFLIAHYHIRYNSTRYTFTVDFIPDYQNAKALYTQKLNEILNTVNPAWTPLQKVLYLNDYVCLHFAYDYNENGEPGDNHDAYVMLRDGVGVCEAYSNLMMALLEDPRVNVPCSFVSSKGINHMWNLVQIDGQWYHMDVTWNDPKTPDGAGHNYFLLSDAVMRSDDDGHVNYNPGATAQLPDGSLDWVYGVDAVCDSTRFDNYFWRDAKSPLLQADETWYLVGERALQAWDGVSDSTTTLLRFYDVYQEIFPSRYGWDENGSFVFSTGLSLADGTLYFCTADLILGCDAASGAYKVYYNLYTELGDFISYLTQCVLNDGKLSYAYQLRKRGSAERETVNGEVELSSVPYPAPKQALSPVVQANGKWYFLDESSLQVWDGASDSFTAALRFSEVYQSLFPRSRPWDDSDRYMSRGAAGLFNAGGTLYIHTRRAILSYDAASGAYQSVFDLYDGGSFLGDFIRCEFKDGKLSYAYEVYNWDTDNEEIVEGEIELSVPAWRSSPDGRFRYYVDGDTIRLQLDSGVTVAAASYDANGKMTAYLFLTGAGEYALPKAARHSLVSLDASLVPLCVVRP